MTNESKSTTAATNDKLKLLLAEDTPAIRALLLEVLESPQIEVVIAADGAEAFNLFCHNRFDVVVTDIRMPVLNGRLATRFMRIFEENNPDLDPTPIIAISANASEADREKCFAAGANAFVSKPIDLSNLVKTIEHFTHLRIDDTTPSDTESSSLVPHRATPFPADPCFDRGAALARLAGDQSLLNQMIQIYQTDHEEIIDKLGASIDQADMKSAARHAHSLKGLSATIGGVEVVKITEELAIAIKNNLLNESKSAFDRVRSANSKLLEQLELTEHQGG